MMTEKKMKKWAVIWGSVAVVAVSFSLVLAYGNTVPGSIFERSDYSAKVYILIYSSETDAKNYRIPAEIERQDSKYWINSAYWPDGRKLRFNDCFNAKLSERVYCIATNGENYWVQLTSDTAKDI